VTYYLSSSAIRMQGVLVPIGAGRHGALKRLGVGVLIVRYNPALDGLRAVAVIFVVAFHISHPIFPGGKVGVDIFFVLSGYLITSILLKESSETGGISLANFYTRRALRLLPALGVLVVFQIIRSAFSEEGVVAGDRRTILSSLAVAAPAHCHAEAFDLARRRILRNDGGARLILGGRS
jgi:Acyltransferase family